MGLKPTNDPLQVIKRRISDAELEARRAQETGGTESFQAVRKLQQQIEDLRQQQEALEQLVLAIPVTVADEATDSGWTPTESWVTVSTVVIPRPAGKTKCEVMAVAGVSGNWSADSVTSWPACAARVVINGVAGPTMPLAQGISAASETASGRVSGTATRAASITGSGDVTVEVQVAIIAWVVPGSHTPSFSDTNAQIAAQAAFTI